MGSTLALAALLLTHTGHGTQLLGTDSVPVTVCGLTGPEVFAVSSEASRSAVTQVRRQLTPESSWGGSKP